MFRIFRKKDDEAEDKKKVTQMGVLIGLGAVTAVLVIVTVLCYKSTVSKGLKAAEAAFTDAKNAAAEQTYQLYYQSSFDRAEKKYHVANEAVINITDVKEVAKLEVLEVSITEYSIIDKSDNTDGITSWLEVPVSGVYTVDLQAGEYLVDQQRGMVTIRLPLPQLEHADIDDANVTKLLFRNDFWNDSLSVGADMHQQQRLEAYEKARSEMTTNPAYYESAEKSARILIENLVREINRDVPGLAVEIEFME